MRGGSSIGGNETHIEGGEGAKKTRMNGGDGQYEPHGEKKNGLENKNKTTFQNG